MMKMVVSVVTEMIQLPVPGLPPEWLPLGVDDDGYAVADVHGDWFKVPSDWTVRIDGCDEPAGFVCEQGK